jgi:hypothetical protein
VKPANRSNENMTIGNLPGTNATPVAYAQYISLPSTSTMIQCIDNSDMGKTLRSNFDLII